MIQTVQARELATALPAARAATRRSACSRFAPLDDSLESLFRELVR